MAKRTNFRSKISAVVYDPSIPYDLAVIRWQRSLTPGELGSFAEDYRRGDRDTVTVDGYREYLRRRAPRRRPSQSKSKLPRCELHKRGTYPKNCDDCRSLFWEQPSEKLQEAPARGDAIDDPIEGSQAIMEAPDDRPAYPNASSLISLSLG
jgi:hypothetical protein